MCMCIEKNLVLISLSMPLKERAHQLAIQYQMMSPKDIHASKIKTE